MIRLWPGCVCHPLLPPGAQTLLCTYTSDNPFVFCHDSQKLLVRFSKSAARSGMRWLNTSIPPNRPRASVVLANPEAGVARAFPTQSAVITIAALNNTNQVDLRIRSPFSMASPHKRRTDRIQYFGPYPQTAMRRIAAVPLLAVECCALPWLAAWAKIGSQARDNRGAFRRARWANHSPAYRDPRGRPKTGWIRGRKSRRTSTAT